MPNFKITDRRLSTLYPPPPKPPGKPMPRKKICWEVLANPDAHDSRRCGLYAGHEGRHAWQICGAEYNDDYYTEGHECELDKGHPPPHRVVIEW